MNNPYHRYGKIATGNTPIDVAWQLCTTNQQIRNDIIERGLEVAQTPHWAYWVARHLITDEWLPGEDLILQDKSVWSLYVQYTETLKMCGCLGHTLRDDPDLIVDGFNVVQGRRLGYARTNKSRKIEPTLTDTADRIAKQMADFQKERKSRTPTSQEDTDDN